MNNREKSARRSLCLPLMVFFVFIIASALQAATIDSRFTVSGTGTTIVPPPNVFAIGTGSGSLDPGGFFDWIEYNYLTISPEATTGILTGTFVMSFANEDTLAGELFEVFQYPDSAGNVTYDQELTILSGTGGLAGVTGTLRGSGTSSQVTRVFSVSSQGLVTTPEPRTSIPALLGLGLLFWYVRRGQSMFDRCFSSVGRR